MSTKSIMKVNDLFPATFQDFFRPWGDFSGFEGLGLRNNNYPAVNISETKDDYMVTMAAPGLKKSDFNIDVEGNLLTISSEKEETKEAKEATYNRKEYSYSSFSRSFTLPAEVMSDKIEATYEDGVLKLTLPKKEEAKKANLSKHIAVK